MKEYKFIIEGLDCPNCSAKLERAIANSKLFNEVSLSFVNKTLVFKSEEDYDCVVNEINKINAISKTIIATTDTTQEILNNLKLSKNK